MLESKGSCDDLVIGDLVFDFDGTEILLGFENFMETDDGKCRSLVVTDGSEKEHVSLGTSFL